MRELIKKEEITKGFTFHYDDVESDTDIFFCKCGHIIKKDRKEIATEMKINVREGSDITDFTNLFDENSMARFSLKCNVCDTDYSNKETSGMVQECGKKFFEAYCFQEDENDVKLLKQRFVANITIEKNGLTSTFVSLIKSKEPCVNLEESISYIKFNKESKKLYFKDFDKEEIEFNLDKVIIIVKSFFLYGESKITERLFDIHLFIDRMANFVSDSKNINIIDELMSQMIGKSGLDVMTKVASIFLGIICYSNLSTIALTKGTMFLYDMMNDCKLPNPKELSDNKATSPLKIFNYLVNYKNEEISKELDADDSEKVGYVFKSKSGKEVTFKYDAERFENQQQTVARDGERFLREDISKKSVSPYIFNTIERFSDYKILIKYTKFISYSDLIELIQKNDVNLLINLWYSIEFRADMNIMKLNQIISLAISSLERRRVINSDKYTADLKYARDKFILSEVDNKQPEEELEKTPLDYSYLKQFDLTSYDDSLRMIRALNWDVNKEFHKIKKIEELEDYHSKLIEHFNLLSNEAKNKGFVSFVSNYKVLEEYDNKLKVSLIKTPESLLKASKEMRNCAGSYVNRVSNGQYLLCMIEDIDPDMQKDEPKEFMLGLKSDKYGRLEFDQVKASSNRQGSDRFKKNVMEFLQEKEIDYKELADLRLSNSKSPAPVFENNNLNVLLNNLMEMEQRIQIPVQNINNPVQNIDNFRERITREELLERVRNLRNGENQP